jgi:hypothetical protein
MHDKDPNLTGIRIRRTWDVRCAQDSGKHILEPQICLIVCAIRRRDTGTQRSGGPSAIGFRTGIPHRDDEQRDEQRQSQSLQIFGEHLFLLCNQRVLAIGTFESIVLFRVPSEYELKPSGFIDPTCHIIVEIFL